MAPNLSRIWPDFSGQTLLESGKYNCIFFKEEWKPASNGIRTAEGETFESCFEGFCKELLDNDIYLVYWTDHERVVLQNYLQQNYIIIFYQDYIM